MRYYLAIIMAVVAINIYSTYPQVMAIDKYGAITITLYGVIIYTFSFRHWWSNLAVLTLSHICAKYFFDIRELSWSHEAITILEPTLTALTYKVLTKVSKMSDFEGFYHINQLHIISIVCTYFLGILAYHTVILGIDEMVAMMGHPEQVFTYMHLFEFAVAANLLLVIMRMHYENYVLGKSLLVAAIGLVFHFSILYYLPGNLSFLWLIHISIAFFAGLKATAFIGVIMGLSSPFLSNVYGAPIILADIKTGYAIMLYVACFMAFIRDAYLDASLRGEGLRLQLFNEHKGGITIAATEITQLKTDLEQKNALLEQQKQAYKKLVEVDELTGAKSRRYFYEKLHDDNREQDYFLLMIDVDDFKSVNDTYGHDVGDRFLKAMTSTVNNIIHETINYGFVARLGGEEFCLAIGVNNAQQACDLATKLLHQIESLNVTYGERQLKRTISIGISQLSHTQSLKNALSYADKALYEAKQKGKNCYVLATEAQQAYWAALANQYTVENIAEGLSKDEFKLFCQPIIDTKSHRLTGMEILVRWQHPSGKTILPAHFIHLLTLENLHSQFMQSFYRQLAGLVAKLDSDHIKRLYFAINMPAFFFQSTGHAEDFINNIKKLSEHPINIVIELPETVETKNLALMRSNIALLKQHNMQLALDDFGLEHSNLDRIRDIHTNFVKLDKSYIVDLTSNPRSQSVIEVLLALSHRLQFDIIAEGVETKEQANMLEALGIQFVQGFYFCEPLPADSQALLDFIETKA